MYSVTEPNTFCSKWSENVTFFTSICSIFHMGRGSSWALDDITVVADAFANVGEETLPSLTCWDDGKRVPGLQRAWIGLTTEEKGARNAC